MLQRLAPGRVRVEDVPSVPGGPTVRLIDAGEGGLDQAGLRARARAETDAAGAPYVTRSYRFPFALVAWHDQPVGVDLERIEPADSDFAVSICTPAERAALADALGDDASVTSLWCSKEALTKALGDAVSYDPRRIESPLRWPGGRCGAWRAAPLAAPADHTAWLCWRGSPARTASATGR